MEWGSGITYLGEARIQAQMKRFGVKDADRLSALTLVGRPGSGRADLLTNMILQDIARGAGVLVLDSAGNLTQSLLERVPATVRDRLIVLDPSDGEHPYSWNPLDDFRALPAEEGRILLPELLAAMYRIENGALAGFAASYLLSHPAATLLFLYQAVAEPKSRDKFFPPQSPLRKDFDALLAGAPESKAAIEENGKYLAKDTLMRNLLGQKASKFTLEALKAGGAVVVDLSRVRMFPTRITPLARLFAEAARAHASPASPVAFYLHDCLRYFSEEEVERMILDRTIALTASDTAYGEEEAPNREAFLHRSGSVIAFAPHEADVPRLERVFYPYLAPEELEKLEPGQMALVLAIDSVRSRPFFATALPSAERTGLSYQDLIVDSRGRYATSRVAVDKLFRSGTEDDKDEEEKTPEPGSFSDAFRSIFTKRAAGASGSAPKAAPAASPAAPKPAPPNAAKPREPKAASGAAKNAPTAEIPEEELRKMLHAGRTPA